jgi:hypothetical protein
MPKWLADLIQAALVQVLTDLLTPHVPAPTSQELPK